MKVLQYSAILLLLGATGVVAQEAPGKNVQEIEAAKKAREIGFGDLEVDNLHGTIAKRLARRIGYGDLPFSIDFAAKKGTGSDRNFMKGRDRAGAVFYRLRLREGTSFSEEERPKQYIFKAHCYLYPAADGKGLDKIVFQFYRVNFSGMSYTRELRRFIHPEPKDLVGGDVLKKEIKMLNNSRLRLEQYVEPSTTKPVWEGPDLIPRPVLQIKPKQQIELNNQKDLMPFDKQVRVIARYKRLLRRVDEILAELNRERALDRLNRIENIMDFPG